VNYSPFRHYDGFPEEGPIYAYKSTADPDTRYHHQAMKQPDAQEFRKAMEKEWNDQLQMEISQVIHRSNVPEGDKTLSPAAWQMRRNTTTGQDESRSSTPMAER
jgi:hypothetical protein